jgi:glycerol-3-phosphate O-acyltransferase
MHDFEDIRPYHDDEVRPVIDSLLDDKDFSKAMAEFKHPVLSVLVPALMKKLVQRVLRKELQHVQTVHDVQIIIEKYLDRAIETTSAGLTQEGVEKLDPEMPYLFVSNHRDITMDPALVNYMLYHHGFQTVQIAIGDNLLKRPFLSDLMRLNKSFIVKRSLQGREMLKASKQLSAYIHHCIDNGDNVWIAQREGRAKDGIDRTESAIIKMLHLADREAGAKLPLHDSMNSLNIIPVSISYEYDPCDELKAKELFAIESTGKFEKDENSDVQSILNGMVGDKGAIHVSFGSKIVLEDAVTAEGMKALIDEQIVANYKLHLVNYLAMEKVQADFMDFSTLPDLFGLSPQSIEKKKAEFTKRLKELSPELYSYVLNMYANPVIRKFEKI